MKCNNEKCQNEAEYKIIHLGSKEVCYCVACLEKYQRIMDAMGSPQPLIFELNEVKP